MKAMNSIPRYVLLTFAVAALTAAPSVLAQPKGAELLITRKAPVSEANSAPKACPKCQDKAVRRTAPQFKGAGTAPAQKVMVHQCPTCANQSVTQGHGKLAVTAVKHTCTASDCTCCGTSS